ncbi:Sc15 protein [Mycena sanguinolenta]|uniref:Sc15 protein n=1 Tax=Mycena sanguinolenta TaxID=230812 RepID=A0A8H7CLM8_9AGAR|nr:Sc15 protein [Mycena sanguinolenta]
MFALRFAPLFLFATSFVSGAAVVEKRSSTADVEAVLNTLKSSADSILPQISTSSKFIHGFLLTCIPAAALTSAGTATDATITPLINDLTTALDTATSSLGDLTPVSLLGSLKKRQSEADIANLVAEIVTDIAQALDTLLADASEIPDLGTLLSGVDTALNQVLSGLETLLAGVLALVSVLCVFPVVLVDVAGLLSSLGLGLTLGSLGL